MRSDIKTPGGSPSVGRGMRQQVVIGDRKSSNTKRLTEIWPGGMSQRAADRTGGGAGLEPLAQAEVVGITAGASTPAWIIKEVCDKMSDEIMEIEESFADMLEQSIKTLNNGDKVTGTVVAITPTEIQVDLGTKHSGYIPVSELTGRPHRQGGGSGEGGRRGGGHRGPGQRPGGRGHPVQAPSGRGQALEEIEAPGRMRPSWRAWLPRTTRAASWCP